MFVTLQLQQRCVWALRTGQDVIARLHRIELTAVDTECQGIGNVQVGSIKYASDTTRTVLLALTGIVQTLVLFLLTLLLIALRPFLSSEMTGDTVLYRPLRCTLRRNQHATISYPILQTLNELLGEELIRAVYQDNGCVTV